MQSLLLLLLACDGGTPSPSEPIPASKPTPDPQPPPRQAELPSKADLLAKGVCKDEGPIVDIALVTLADGRALVEVNCDMFAYQGSYMYAWTGDVRPVLDQNGTPFRLLGFPSLDPATGGLEWVEKARGIGDCGSYFRYALEGDRFVQKEHRSRECDDAADDFPPPDKWPLVNAAVEGHCESGETVYFSCATSTTRALSVCGRDGRVQYRFGPPGNPELRYPSTSLPSAFTLSEETTIRATATVLSFSSGDITYKVTDAIGSGGGPDAAANNFQGVYVYQGGKEIAAISCKEAPKTDWKALQALVQ